MTYEEYESIEAVNWSTLKSAELSMLQYRHAVDHPSPDTAPKKVGRGGHTSILEPDRFALDCAVYEDSKSKGEGSRLKWAAFQQAHEGRTILDAKQYERCLRMRDAVRSHPIAGPLLNQAGDAERSIRWLDVESALYLKCRVDFLPVKGPFFVDLKTTRNPFPWAFARDAAKFGYHRQCAFYQRGVRAATGENRTPVLIAVQNIAPYEVWVYTIADLILRRAWHGSTDPDQPDAVPCIASLLVKVAHAREVGRWPGACREIEDLQLPPYVPGADDGDGLEIISRGE